ncbi:MAG: Peptidoglycan O-acetyltransferase [Saezia sanguinis]
MHFCRVSLSADGASLVFMLFPTVEFGLFFLLALGISWGLYRHLVWQKAFLLLVSYVFYGFWSWAYVPLLFGISLFAALIAQQIQRHEDKKVRKRWLILGVVGCLAVLAHYKYTVFFLETLLDVWSIFGPPPTLNLETIELPLGVSFFVFHAISLLGDVYRNKLKQKVEIGDSLLYVAFFPQLIAGPILRASYFMPQLRVPRDPQHIRTNRALMLIVMGLFKKVVIANTLATRVVDPVFAAPELYSGADMLLGIYAYAVQIYCDFSGYTDIAIGCAMLMGFKFPKNFDSPYMAASPQEFWRRWHISLSTWLRDYLYIPLGGSHKGPWRTNLNLMVTMLLGGLWHGANWTFVVWGALHGFYLVVHRLWSLIPWPALQRMRKTKTWRWVARLLLFHAVCLGWVFFRSSSFDLAFDVLGRLSDWGAFTLASAPVLVMLLIGLAGQYTPRRCLNGLELLLARWPAFTRGLALAVAVFVIDLLGPTGIAPFIYFQF